MLSSVALASIVAVASAANWSTYPSVAKTASINGFADRIYDQLPSCAQSCVKTSTSSTPCPYWDTGCLCVMTTWASDVADCFADKCSGDDVTNAQNLAVNLCKAAGVWEPYWIIDSSASSSLSAAAAKEAEATTTEETTSAQKTSAAATTAEETTKAATSAAPETTKAATSAAPETTKAATSAAPETTAAATSAAPETTEATKAAASQAVASVSTYTGGAAGVVPAAVAGAAAGIAMLL